MAAWGVTLTDEGWAQATLPQRRGGFGLPACSAIADAAFVASKTKTHELVQAVFPAPPAPGVGGGAGASSSAASLLGGEVGRPDLANLADLPLAAARARLAAATHPEAGPAQEWPASPDNEEWEAQPTQHAAAFKVAKARFRALWGAADGRARAHYQAQCGPGAAAWLQLTPSPDNALSDGQFATALAYRLGLPHNEEGPGICRSRGRVCDAMGVHDLSCTSGGDIIHRHNAVRDLVFDLARRARVQPQLERAGIFTDPVLHLHLRRPADVLVQLARGPNATPAQRLPTFPAALDVKIINATGRDHGASGPQPDADLALRAYADQARRLNNTAAQCAAHGVELVPMVFLPRAAGARRAIKS